MYFKTLPITEVMAKKMLKEKRDNRNIAQNYVRRLADSMERGEWVLNSVPIILDKKGKVIDGQHRLSAILLYKKPVKMAVAYDVDKNAYKTIDIGRRRSPGDMLSMQGEKDCNVLASVLRLYNSFREKDLNSLNCNTAYISPRQTEILLGQNPGIRDGVRFASGNKKPIQLLMTPSIAATFHFIFGRRNTKNRNDFFESLIGGANLGKNNPIYILRQILLERRVRYSTKDKPMICCLMIKTWNNKFGGRRDDIVYDPEEKMPKVLG
jgi:hypothetical protein